SAREGLRQPEAERLVDLELLPSLQGLVWRVLADGVRATVADGRLTITRPGGLRLADGPPTPDPPSEPATPAAGMGTATSDTGLGLAGLAGADPADRQALRQRIVDGLHGLAGLPRAEARLELARLYLADALGPEARTALDLIEARDLAGPAAASQRLSRLALGGAAEALSGRPDPALVKLLDHALDEDPEVALWRAYAAALASRRELADQEWSRSGGLPDGYPDPLRRRLGLELAALLLEGADPAAARALLERLKGLRLEPEERARLALLEGRAQAGSGAALAAERSFAAAAAGGDPDTATRAAFLLTDQRLSRGELTAGQGLAELALQRPRWRGHPLAAPMLARLAALQAAAGRPVTAVASWGEAIAASRSPGEAAGPVAAMRRQLTASLADETLPTTMRLALALAHGQALDGDPRAGAIRARLALAAARLGLAEAAGELLAAAGPAADAVRAELARSLAAAGRPAAARPRAGSKRMPPDPRAELAAAERAGDWPRVAALAEAALASASPDRPLTADQAENLLWLAIAQGRLGREAQAATLASRYRDRIAGPAERALLALATLPAPAEDDPGQLAAAAAGFAGAIRAGLAALPRLDRAPPVRTASAR
ncbi:MAG: hypothetical protein AB7X49_27480, partial [Geminicoccaceae bacterium]